MIGWQELVIILAIVMVIFGTNKITGIGKSMGTAIRDFRDAMKNEPDKPKPAVDAPKEEKASEETPKEAGQTK